MAELRCSLDLSVGEIARNLDNLYEFLGRRPRLADGKQIEASDKAKAIKAKGEEVQKTLGMKEA
mgnify:CR=1 FL=1